MRKYLKLLLASTILILVAPTAFGAYSIQLNSPSNEATFTNTKPTFTWSYIGNNEDNNDAEIGISTNPITTTDGMLDPGNNTSIYNVDYPNTSFNQEEALDPGTYYWRVVSDDNEIGGAAISELRKFTIKAEQSTAINLESRPSRFKAGRRTKLTATVYRSVGKGRLSDKVVHFQKKVGRGWRTFMRKRTNQNGQAATYVRVRSSAVFRAVFSGDTDYKRSEKGLRFTEESNVISQVVKKKYRAIVSVSASPATFRAGASTRLVVTLSRSSGGRRLKGKTIRFQQKRGRKWSTFRRARTNSRGQASTSVRPGSGSAYRVVYSGDRHHAKGIDSISFYRIR